MLAIHPGALGDVLLAVPALRALRAAAAASCAVSVRTAGASLTDTRRLTVAAQPRIGALLVALGVADRAVNVDALGLDALFAEAPPAPLAPLAASATVLARELAAVPRVVCWFGARDANFVRRLRALAPDAIVAPPHPTLAPSAVVASPNPAAGGDGAAPADVALPVWRHLLHTIAAGAGGCEPIVVPDAIRDEARRALSAIGWDGASRVLVVHPGAGGVAKRWPAQGFAAALQGFATANTSARGVPNAPVTIVVHQGPADAEAVRAFGELADRPVLRLIEPALTTLAGVLAVAAERRDDSSAGHLAYVGNDSGVSHLAAAVGAPSVVLFVEANLPWMPWSLTARPLTVTTSELRDDDCRAARAAVEAMA